MPAPAASPVTPEPSCLRPAVQSARRSGKTLPDTLPSAPSAAAVLPRDQPGPDGAHRVGGKATFFQLPVAHNIQFVGFGPVFFSKIK